MNLITPGDKVICVLPPAVSVGGLPLQRPSLGKTYTAADTYVAKYGIGIKLEELDPFPYEGYVLWAQDNNSLHVAAGWYFARIERFRSPLEDMLP
jgi:hypothetical protein